MGNTKEYKVFISYSWTTIEHENWVYDLAVRLREHGLDVKFDKWDLKPGQDKFKFMESMIEDDTLDRVLIICDKQYKEKADKRHGGVGTETEIITPEVYNKTRQGKFIPIIVEKGENFDSYLPHYLKSRIAIDMSCDEVYEKGYEQLLRLIYERPQFRKPAKGEPPSFLFEDEKPHFKTKNLNKQLKHQLLNRPELANFFINDFVDEFKNSLKQFNIEYKDLKQPYDEQIYNNINDMLDLRNDYVEFLSLLCKLNKTFNIEIIINLFEDIYSYTEFNGNGTFNELQFDHYKFFITEMFLYTCSILIENNLFEKLNILLSTKYFIKTKYEYNEDGVEFTKFRFFISSIDKYRNERLELRRFSLTADLLVQRSQMNCNYKEKLLDTDLLLYYISTIKFKNKDIHYWYPMTYFYKGYRKIDLLKRMVIQRHFEKVKELFNAKSKEEMKQIVSSYTNPYSKGYNSSFDGIPNIVHHVKVDEIAMYK